MKIEYAVIAQSAEHVLGKDEVARSNRANSSTKAFSGIFIRKKIDKMLDENKKHTLKNKGVFFLVFRS